MAPPCGIRLEGRVPLLFPPRRARRGRRLAARLPGPAEGRPEPSSSSRCALGADSASEKKPQEGARSFAASRGPRRLCGVSPHDARTGCGSFSSGRAEPEATRSLFDPHVLRGGVFLPRRGGANACRRGVPDDASQMVRKRPRRTHQGKGGGESAPHAERIGDVARKRDGVRLRALARRRDARARRAGDARNAQGRFRPFPRSMDEGGPREHCFRAPSLFSKERNAGYRPRSAHEGGGRRGGALRRLR